MGMKDVTRQDVRDAIAEFDEIGREAFLDRYGMGEATSYMLWHEGRAYDSKAIMAAAHGHHPGFAPLAASEFSGGVSHAVRYLRNLGFSVVTTRPPVWTRDELILACDLVYQNNWRGLDTSNEEVQRLSELLQRIPIHPVEVRGPKFRNPNGAARKTFDLATRHPDWRGAVTNGGAGDLEVMKDFLADGPKMHRIALAIRAGVESGGFQEDYELFPDIDDPENGGIPEGRLLERKHIVRERNPKKRQEKIDQHRRANDGNLACETCGFDFKATYGDHGDGYIECHHIIPLSESGETQTRLADLILICSNCHRMIHRRSPWLKPEELRAMITGPSNPASIG